MTERGGGVMRILTNPIPLPRSTAPNRCLGHRFGLGEERGEVGKEKLKKKRGKGGKPLAFEHAVESFSPALLRIAECHSLTREKGKKKREASPESRKKREATGRGLMTILHLTT